MVEYYDDDNKFRSKHKKQDNGHNISRKKIVTISSVFEKRFFFSLTSFNFFRTFSKLSETGIVPKGGETGEYGEVLPLLRSLNRHSGNTGREGLHLPVSSRPPPSASDQVKRSTAAPTVSQQTQWQYW